MVENRGFTLLLLEFPPKQELGLDNLSLNPGELFKGIKNIPQGLHFLYTSLRLGKTGRFFYTKEHSIIIMKWDTTIETFIYIDQEEESLYKNSIEEFLPLMVEYPNESWALWKELTDYITPKILFKLEPLSGMIPSASKEYDIQSQELESFNCNIPVIHYTPIPKRYFQQGMSAESITLYNYDKTAILRNTIGNGFDTFEELLGEMQFAFVSFLIGENPDSFEQWKNIFVLLCNCEQGVREEHQWFSKYIPVLYAQVKSLPKDLVVDPFLSSSFITSSLKSFISIIDDSSLNKTLQIRGEKLKKLVLKEFNISELDMIDDEEAPSIVYTD
ncbi:hypothetical protein SteCoe_21303 [Stentor coeruleus]|uniref:AAR2 splicing factor homolog n=1 Tax=Stentor coeruleus TaxID=5963 RepID=A0A1R2BPQ6_9CILI|nr:hypothetical protein SteCoe_21303 [Stentor coeruleus]